MPLPLRPSPEREEAAEAEETENEACRRRHKRPPSNDVSSSHRRSTRPPPPSTPPSPSLPSPSLPLPPRTSDHDACDIDESYPTPLFSSSSEDASNLLVDRTWCLHAVSPLTTTAASSTYASSKKNHPIPRNNHPHNNQRSSSSSSSTSNGNGTKIGASASQLRDRLTRDLCHGGDYCQVRWLSTTSTTTTTSSTTRGYQSFDASDGDGDKGRQGPILHDEAEQHHRHLLLEFYARETLAAAIALCFVGTIATPTAHNGRRRKRSKTVVRPPSGEGGRSTVRSSSSTSGSAQAASVLSSIGFALSRGSHTTCQLVWEWLEWHGGCAIQRHPFCPSAAQLAAAAASWTLRAYRDAAAAAEHRPATTTTTPHPHEPVERDRSKDLPLCRPSSKRKRPVTPSGRSASKASPPPSFQSIRPSVSSATVTRPLVLTFVPPPSLQGRGLDTVSAVVTPADLCRLCRTLVLQQTWEEPRDRTSPSLSLSEQQQQQQLGKSQPLPVLKVLTDFVTRETGLPLDQCNLIQASCSIAALGADGRCKPHSSHYLHDCWAQLLIMVQQRHHHPSGRSRPGNDDDDTAARRNL